MKLLGYRWPLVLWSRYDRLLSENNYLKQHLRETQLELHKHKLLLGRLASEDEATTQAFERARQAVRDGKL